MNWLAVHNIGMLKLLESDNYYTDAASAYLEGYQKYPKSQKAPVNLLKTWCIIGANRRKRSRLLNDNWSKKAISKSKSICSSKSKI